ncbi:hypothetical protein BJ508DRAFT_336380 [Ascobolus immersus RN42]|uniref:Uncharacterized protein n=1 Tax=Ascobolus immersus RN42 TaxID=1160509 RepID=A0A3N4H8N5_ASCIM|nr:hypothetical protein BJ508DRAFT_336380 [Ascobolus immersus RN42]
MVVQHLNFLMESRASDPLGMDDDDVEKDSEIEQSVKTPKKRPPVGSSLLIAIRAVVLTESDNLEMP